MKNLIKKFIPSFLLSWYHFLLAFGGAFFYRFPAKKLKVIGITGTKGKSTVIELGEKILEKAGYKVASISSIKFKIGNEEWKNELKMTMPGRFKLQRFLRKAVNRGCQYAILEVTSEGILQYRHKFIDFDAVVFTNLFPEHIERHGSFEKYQEAKGKLFQKCKKTHIINLDDKNSEYFLQFPAEKKFGFSTSGVLSSSIKAENIQELATGVSFEVQGVNFKLNLFGKFNVENALAAICLGLSQGLSLENCKKTLEKIKGISGRMEIVIEKPFKVIVDYAHTPNSLEKVYKIVSRFKIQGSKLVCLLGSCGGGRDKWKRPKLGEIAARYCDEIILTNEDPYDENPLQIINEIEQGILKLKAQSSKLKTFHKILDRREAINKALSSAKPNDTVIITGKGSEPWLCIEKGKKIPWDDCQIVREEFKGLNL